MKQALLDRGWYFNADRESFFFDLKWTLKSNELRQDQLAPFQLTNHFLKNTALTTKVSKQSTTARRGCILFELSEPRPFMEKPRSSCVCFVRVWNSRPTFVSCSSHLSSPLFPQVGLLKSLKELSWFTNAHEDSIYPRSYDLNSAVDMQAFLDDYRVTAAMGMLKEVVHRCRTLGASTASSSFLSSSSSSSSSAAAPPPAAAAPAAAPEPAPAPAPAPAAPAKGAGRSDTAQDRVRQRSHFAVPFDASSFDATVAVNGGALDVALRVCRRLAFPALDDDAYLDAAPQGPTAAAAAELEPPVTDVEWEVLGYASRQLNNDHRPPSSSGAGPGGDSGGSSTAAAQESGGAAAALDRPVFRAWDRSALLVAGKPPRPLDAFLGKGSLAGVGGGGGGPEAKDARAKQEAERLAKRRAEAAESERRRLGPLCCGPASVTPVGLARLESCYVTLAALDARSPQCALNGRMCTKNLWIVKPSAKSRGRGIMAFRDIGKLLEYIGVSESQTGQSSTMWVVQKYMENPLIVARRKFDIRQWVLVTDWNPLTIYFYESCYARFSAAEYSDRDDDLENVNVHLVNNSIAKTSGDFNAKVVAENGVEIKDCMWSRDQIAAFMKFKAAQRGIFKGHDSGAAISPGVTEGEDVYETRCMAHMREIAKCALMTAQGQVEARKNSWELYG